MAGQQDIMKQALGKVVATAWNDADYKARLLNTPRLALADVGLQPPPHIEIRVLENTSLEYFLALPSPLIDTSTPALMQRLQTDPATVLADAGIQLPPQASLSLVHNTAQLTYIVLPLPPGYAECSIEKL